MHAILLPQKEYHVSKGRLGAAAAGLRQRFQHQLGGDGDGGLEAAVDGAMSGKEAVDAAGSFPVFGIGLEAEDGVDAADDEDIVLGFDFAGRVGDKAIVRGRNLTRFQRASEGAGESAAGSGDDVVQGGGVGLEDVRGYFVVFGNGAVDSEEDGLRLGGEIRAAQRSFDALDADMRAIGDCGHAGNHSSAAGG